MDVNKIEVQPLWSSLDWTGELPASLSELLSVPNSYLRPSFRQTPILIASLNGDIIGWIVLADCSEQVIQIFVKPEHRRRGIGTRLFRCQVSIVLSYGADRIKFPSQLSDDTLSRNFIASTQSCREILDTQTESPPDLLIKLSSQMSAFQHRIQTILKTLTIPPSYGIERGLRLQEDPADLTHIGPDCWQRPQKMIPRAAAAWTLMQHSADNDNVKLLPVSAFRSIDYQTQLIERKLAAGQTIEDILQVSAAPGFSEHHSGRAIDITDGVCAPLENEFADCKAFQWLNYNAEDFGFYMSYPKDNPHGIIWEPWHWCWREN